MPPGPDKLTESEIAAIRGPRAVSSEELALGVATLTFYVLLTFVSSSPKRKIGLAPRPTPAERVMAGGLDTFDWLKDRTKRPSVVVDLSQVSELRGIKEAGRA